MFSEAVKGSSGKISCFFTKQVLSCIIISEVEDTHYSLNIYHMVPRSNAPKSMITDDPIAHFKVYFR